MDHSLQKVLKSISAVSLMLSTAHPGDLNFLTADSFSSHVRCSASEFPFTCLPYSVMLSFSQPFVFVSAVFLVLLTLIYFFYPSDSIDSSSLVLLIKTVSQCFYLFIVCKFSNAMVLKFAVLLAKQLMLFIILYEVLANAGYVEFIESVFLMSAYSGKSLLIAETQLPYFIYNVFSKSN